MLRMSCERFAQGIAKELRETCERVTKDLRKTCDKGLRQSGSDLLRCQLCATVALPHSFATLWQLYHCAGASAPPRRSPGAQPMYINRK